ncbi:hypothetical protein [Leifsonia naganoensis]|uniref:Uncharacterized protein n=1 Tax=Leifsonia naganoensis TaxID=150025 RepID=A0A853DLZ6_9MICO|nr:hypothetical protein [Leifsonia naganoensis]NYK10096.1 hypothetical protein [Leifsonia naganoensis]
MIARDEIARVLIDALRIDAADHTTFELVAEKGQEQEDLTPAFAALEHDAPGSLDGAKDAAVLPLNQEPDTFLRDLEAVRGK